MEDRRDVLPTSQLPTAYLLTGDDAAARRLLTRALARGPGLEALVRTHLRRRPTRDATLTGTSGDPWWIAPADLTAARATADALDRLTAAERTAAVLRWYEHRDDVAALVPGVDTDALPARLGIPEAELPARLEGLAGLADTRDLTDADLDRAARELRTRRRTRVLLAVGVVAALVVAVLRLPGTPGTAGTASGATTAQGSLVDDEQVVSGLRDRLGPEGDGARLVYAGDAAGARWALFAQGTGDEVLTSWLTGAEGAAPADLVLARVSGRATGVRAATVETPDASALLVVADPGTEVDVSPGVDVAADGSTSRTFTPLDLQDGVAAVQLDRRGGQGVVYRAVRDDVVVGTDSPVTSCCALPAPGPDGAARSGQGPTNPTAYAFALDQVLGPTGRVPGDVEATVLGTGSYPTPDGRTADAVTVAVVLPGGAVATSTIGVTPDGSGTACGTETHPAGTDLAALVVVTRCAAYAGDSSTFGVRLVVVAPAGAEVVLDAAAGGTPVAAELTDGWGYVVDRADDLTRFSSGGAPGDVSRAGSGPLAGA